MTIVSLPSTDSYLAAFLKIAHPAAVRVLIEIEALTHLILDVEHGAFSDADLELLCSLITLGSKRAVVRVPAADPLLIGRALDRGADGILIPRVRSSKQVEIALRGMKTPPDGERGWDPTVASFAYGQRRGRSPIMCAVQMETSEALRDARQIASLSQVTDLFVGPADLARDLGSVDDLFPLPVVEAIARLPEATAGTGARLGLFVDSAERARWAYDLGYRFFAITSDVTALAAGVQSAISRLSTAGVPVSRSQGVVG